MSYLRDLRRAVNDPRSFWPINAFGGGGAASSLAQTLVTTWSSSGDGLAMVFETAPSIFVEDSGTPENYTNLKLSSSLSDFSAYLTYTNPHVKIVRQADGTYKYCAHNLYLNSASPANQAITVVSGASYAVTITGSVSVTASGAATGTWTAGTNTFTAATTTLTLGSTSGSGTVHVYKTPADATYLATTGAARYALPISYDSSGVAEGLLVEPAATNLIVSNDPGDVDGNATVVESAQVAPSGLTEAATAEFDGTDIVAQSITISASTTYTYSVYVKNIDSVGIIEMQWRNISAANKVSVWFNLANGTRGTVGSASGTVTYVDSGIEDVDGSGWYRVWIAASTSGTNCTPVWFAVTADNGSTRDDSGVVAFWRDQLEAASRPTSLILTNGAMVTRDADLIDKAATAFNLGSAFSMYVKYTISRYANFPQPIGITDGGTTNRVDIYTGATSAVTYRASASGTNINLGNMTGLNTSQKVACRAQEDSFNAALNGTAGTADTSGSMPTGLTILDIGDGRSGVNQQLSGLIKEILIVPEGWNDATLESITT